MSEVISKINTLDAVPSPGDIRLFLTDVDGTLTDGGMYYGTDGTEFKKFNTRDGMGLQMLQRTGVKTSHEGILMPHVTSEFETSHMGIGLTIACNELPRAVARTVINIEDVTLVTHLPLPYHGVKQTKQTLVALRQ